MWGIVSVDFSFYLVFLLIVELIKFRFCLDVWFLNLWMIDVFFLFDIFVDVFRYVYYGLNMIKCDDKFGYDNVFFWLFF